MYPAPDEYDLDVRDRVYGRATSSSEGRRSIVVVLLSVSVFIVVFAVSCRQVTAEGPARNIIESGLVSLTDLDQLLADQGPALRQAALESQDQGISFDGYPLDIVLTRDEVLKSSDAQLRDIILRHEPRLANVRVSSPDSDETVDRTFRFKIEAELDVDPAPEPILFDSLVKPATGVFEVGTET